MIDQKCLDSKDNLPRFKMDDDHTLVDLLTNGIEDINDEDELFCHQYVEKLASYNLSKLVSEPQHLKEEKSSLLEQTQKLAYDDYQTFIQAAECSREIYKDFKIVEDHVDSLSEHLPMFTGLVENFSKSSQEINSSRKQNSLVLSRHTQLLEILEISQLMDTCVRNSHYEEALELSSFVRRLGKKFASIKIITDIGNEVKRSTQLMLNQLLQQLKGNIQLPACLRIISYIRQLDAFDEAELRITFLQARDSWFQSVVSQIPADDAYTHLSKTIEACRVHLFDIITHYKAIFSDDDVNYTSTDDLHHDARHILNSWVLKKIRDFMCTLHEDINKGVSGRLDAIYGQCMYFGLSFSRIGADFRPVMVPVFHRYMMEKFKSNIALATKRFEEDISTYSVSSLKQSLKDINHNNRIESITPPQELLDFQPIAIYINAILNTMNELRQHPATSFVYTAKDTIMNSLEKVIHALENWAKLESKSQPQQHQQTNTDVVKTLCSIVYIYFLPYMAKIFDSFFQHDSITQMVGRLPHNISSMENRLQYSLQIEKFKEVLKSYVDPRVLIYEDVVVKESSETENPINNPDNEILS